MVEIEITSQEDLFLLKVLTIKRGKNRKYGNGTEMGLKQVILI